MEQIQQALKLFKRSQGQQDHQDSFQGERDYQDSFAHTKRVAPIPSSLIAHRVLTTAPRGPFLEAYKILRIQILHRLRENNWSIIGVTSPGSGEGKTLVAANLAISIAMEPNQTALLIDGNLRNPQVHELFGIENKGLADFLLDNVSLPDLLINPQIDRFCILPAGGPLQNSVEALTLPKMKNFVEEMKHQYSSCIVLFDLPPMLNNADVIGLAPMLDALVLVVEASRTTDKDVKKSISLLNGSLPIVGTILNKAG